MRLGLLVLLLSACASNEARPDPALAGQYVFEFNRFYRTNLTLSEDGEFRHSGSSCTGFRVYERGRWTAEDGVLTCVSKRDEVLARIGGGGFLGRMHVEEDSGDVVLRARLATYRRVRPCESCEVEPRRGGICFTCGLLEDDPPEVRLPELPFPDEGAERPDAPAVAAELVSAEDV